jgi:hypothetical protein
MQTIFVIQDQHSEIIGGTFDETRAKMICNENVGASYDSFPFYRTVQQHELEPSIPQSEADKILHAIQNWKP